MKRFKYLTLAALVAFAACGEVEAQEVAMIAANGQSASIALTESQVTATTDGVAVVNFAEELATYNDQLVMSVATQNLTMMAMVAKNAAVAITAEQNLTTTMAGQVATINAAAKKNTRGPPTATTLAPMHHLYGMTTDITTAPARNSSQTFTTATNNYGAIPTRSSPQTIATNNNAGANLVYGMASARSSLQNTTATFANLSLDTYGMGSWTERAPNTNSTAYTFTTTGAEHIQV